MRSCTGSNAFMFYVQQQAYLDQKRAIFINGSAWGAQGMKQGPLEHLKMKKFKNEQNRGASPRRTPAEPNLRRGEGSQEVQKIKALPRWSPTEKNVHRGEAVQWLSFAAVKAACQKKKTRFCCHFGHFALKFCIPIKGAKTHEIKQSWGVSLRSKLGF